MSERLFCNVCGCRSMTVIEAAGDQAVLLECGNEGARALLHVTGETVKRVEELFGRPEFLPEPEAAP